ncbi:MAG: hypothetical protein FJW30_22290 [Acidobacteria bacterium]|nr:hypothetical protein [Acidobacteriota bacterium]
MNQQRWAKIEKIYFGALSQPAHDRLAYLDSACSHDPDLRREVDSLLAQDHSAPGLLDGPAWTGAEALLAPAADPDLAPGTRLGPYEITGLLGQGGMGRVYAAHDSRLGRSVAIKVASTEFSDRFRQEARAVAALNHPNICTLYDVGPNYLVMELVEGPTLEERIRKGPIPPAESIEIARQIADALEAAHERAVVHRDLKPGNIKIKPDGKVKVIDFGLAKAADPASPAPGTPPVSLPGTIMGTAAYMAPEQAAGKPMDRRVDIWSFGVVFAEMLSGQKVFSGETISETLAAVMKDSPQLDGLPSDLPTALRKLLGRCLEKDPRKRLRDIGEARVILEGGLDAEPQLPRRSRLPFFIAAAAAAVCGVLLWRGSASVARPPVVRMNLSVPQTALRGFAISPNGEMLAYSAPFEGNPMIWIRRLDSLTAEPRLGTEEGYAPFWSPDSKTIAFVKRNALLRVDAAGSSLPQTICTCSVGRGSWNAAGTILLNSNASAGGLVRISSSGGKPERLNLKTSPDEQGVRWPMFLSDGKRFIYFSEGAEGKPGGIYATSIDNPQQRVLVVASSTGAWLTLPEGGRPGYLFYSSPTGALLAVEFDESSLQLKGERRLVSERVAYAAARELQFSASNNGVAAYSSVPASTTRFVWLDRAGKEISIEGPADAYNGVLRLSPDTRRLSTNRDQERFSIWTYEFGRGALTPITYGPASNAQWSRDGAWIVYSSRTNGWLNLFRKRSDGTGEEERLTNTPHDQQPWSVSPDGVHVLYSQAGAAGNHDLWLVPLAGNRQSRPILQTPFDEQDGQLSPDGKWLAYVGSLEGGAREVFIQGFSSESGAVPGSRRKLSTGGGLSPRWRADSKEIFYWSGSHIMAVSIQTASTGLELSPPKTLFPYTSPGGRYDVAPDGRRFLGRQPDRPDAFLTVLTNWFGVPSQ